MSLALRLFIWFGLLALVPTVVVGSGARQVWRRTEERRFEDQLEAAKVAVSRELEWEASQIRTLLQPKCAHEAYIDKALIDLEARELGADRRLAVSELVREEMKALQLDELLLFTGSGEILGAGHDAAAPGKIDRALADDLAAHGESLAFRPPSAGERAALVTRCSKTLGSQTIGLRGARYLEPILDRIGAAYRVRLSLLGPSAPRPSSAESTLAVEPRIAGLAGLRLLAAISRRELEENLAWVDELFAFASVVTVGVAILSAILLARSLARPLEELADQAGEVVGGQPRPIVARGSRELRAFARAFNKALEDLVLLRKRLATTERIAARREIARQVAHEIKNPLAPIRAAVETLRRLRARADPAFDEYFDEATRTVLDEVFRITRIVSEFTEFARLPPPHPGPVKLEEVARSTVALYAAGGAEVTIEAAVSPIIQADRDQLAQVLTNLIQNGLDAAKESEKNPRVMLRIEGAGDHRVAISVSDNGPGVSAEMIPRLFEPYATSKPNGTGLGLAIVQRIVQEHGGELTYQRAAAATGYAGALFRVILPLAGPKLPPPGVEPAAESRPEPRG